MIRDITNTNNCMKIETKQLIKSYTIGGEQTPILKGIDLYVDSGEFVVLSGKSGAGKSTLLYQLSMLSRPTDGQVLVDGVDVGALSEKDRTAFRLTNFGFIFQDFALSRDLTAQENVALPLICLGYSFRRAYADAILALDRVGLAHRSDNYPEQLSGGEQQRVAIARAVVTRPNVIFADEPTASLDTANSENVLEIISNLHKTEKITVIMITHEERYKHIGERIIELEDGKII